MLCISGWVAVCSHPVPLNHVGDVGGILPLKLAGRLTCYHEILEKCPHRVFTTVWRSWFHMGQRRIYFLIRCVCFFYFAFFPLFRTWGSSPLHWHRKCATYPQCCHNVNVIFSFACIDFWSVVDYECAMWLNQAPVLMWSSTFPPKHVSAGTLLRHFVRICAPQRHSDSAQVTVVTFMSLCFSRTKA